MTEFFAEVIQPVNLPATILFGLVMLYWVMVIFGTVGLEMFDFDMDLDADGVDIGGGGGFLHGLLQFFHLGEVPVTIFGSIFAILYWAGTILGNHYWNSEWSIMVGVLVFVPCMVVSLLATKLIIMPVAPMFRRSSEIDEDYKSLVGQLAVVSTGEVTDAFGEVSIQQDGPPLVLNARCHGARLQKGEVVELVSYDQNRNTWLVKLPKK
jgi:hypothetical protein